jgi:hypothetical protein
VPLHQTYEYYEWYQPNSYFPILSISTFTLTSSFINRYSKTVAYRAGYTSSGINDISSSSKGDLLVYPNPSNDHVNLVYEMHEAGESQIAIYDLTGRLVQTAAYTSGAGVQTVPMSTSALSMGMYEVRVSNAESTTSVKLQVVK